MSLCLDTSAYSHFKAANQEVTEIISTAKTVGIPAIVLGELRAGFRLGQRCQDNEAELRAFLANPSVRVLNVDEEASHCYAEIFLELRHNGTPVPTNDMWIAALALREGATIVTFDAHFDLIRRVGLVLLR